MRKKEKGDFVTVYEMQRRFFFCVNRFIADNIEFRWGPGIGDKRRIFDRFCGTVHIVGAQVDGI